ncbi:hypothetical protein [Oceanobacillus kimchii]|uniref:Uncharacterized protein n=1 Tax=Oceanobacillus kimchii TaxID=746691 RepID=A0ABQ5THC9_9BACI|nr:hypothetical protein [Oceanobacillus kimchii]GLO66276.1 hypothetical protein MACH08_20600 [Oceanobacillus kimchii]
MSKTDLTVQLERDIFRATGKMGTFGCFEVTIGWYGRERVDYLTYDTKGVWRCYEIKVSKSDFYSKAKKTFVGHFNYLVLTKELYEQVKQDIPSHIGVYVHGQSVKRAKRQELKVNEEVLTNSLIRSLARESDKQFLSKNPNYLHLYKKRISNLEKELENKNRYLNEIMDIGYKKYGSGWYHDDIEEVDQ